MLGAILLFAILVTTMVTIQTRYVPVWDKQREADAASGLANQLAVLKSDLERLSANQTTVPITDPLALGRAQGFTFFQGRGNTPATVGFTPTHAGSGLNVSSTQLTLSESNGQALYGLSESWTSVGAGQTVTSVEAIRHLRVRIIDPANSQGSLTIRMTDINGQCAGVLSLVDTVQGGSDNNVEAQVFGPASPLGASCAASPISIEDWNEKKQLSPPYFYWDAFDANSQFPAVLAAAHYPVSLALSLSSLQGDYTIAYDQASPGGVILAGGTGIVIPAFRGALPTGTLAVAVTNQRLPSQTFTFEYGALIMDQTDGSVMAIPPSFTVSSSGTHTQLAWSFAALAGNPGLVQGAREGIVTAAPSGTHTGWVATAPDLTFALSTTHPDVWKSYWDAKMTLAGLQSTSGPVAPGCLVATPGANYRVTTTATTATLEVFGPCPNAGDATGDIALAFQESLIAVLLTSGP